MRYEGWVELLALRLPAGSGAGKLLVSDSAGNVSWKTAAEAAAQGPQGLIGPQGLAGSQGLTGLKGDTGLQGPKGDTGLQGSEGPTGLTGSKGDTGLQGLPGAGADIKQTEVDFGQTPRHEALFTVADLAVTAGSQIVGAVAYEAPTGRDRDEVEMDPMVLSFGPGTAQFTVFVKALEGRVYGKYKINYLVA